MKGPEQNFSRWWSLLRVLIFKDIRIRYKQAHLGVLWVLFQPLAMMAVFTVVFTRVANVDTKDIPYPLFAYVGILPWTFFSQGLVTSTTSLVSSASIFTKIYVPKNVFPLSCLGARFVDFLLSASVLLVLFIYYGVIPSLNALWIFPFFLNQIAFMVGCAFLLSMGNLFYRDVGFILNVLITIWMFMTPVLYPLPVGEGLIGLAVALNPMTSIINAYRDGLLTQTPILFQTWVESFVVCFGICGVSWWFFKRLDYLFAERV